MLIWLFVAGEKSSILSCIFCFRYGKQYNKILRPLFMKSFQGADSMFAWTKLFVYRNILFAVEIRAGWRGLALCIECLSGLCLR